MDSSRPSFQRKPDARHGVRLILRNVSSSGAVAARVSRAQLAAGQPAEPARNITVGHYVLAGDPPSWAFRPGRTAAAIALLGVEMVRDRICEDLAAYLKERRPEDGANAAGPYEAGPKAGEHADARPEPSVPIDFDGAGRLRRNGTTAQAAVERCYCEFCERVVPTREDRGDVLCSVCGLVL